MKTIDKTALCLLFFAVSAFTAARAADEPAVGQRTAVIAEINGAVEMRGAEERSEWKPAEAGIKLREGYSVKTGKDSSASIHINGAAERAKIELNSDSRLSVVELSRKDATGKTVTILSLELGKASVKTFNMDPRSLFQVKTPTSIVESSGPNSSFNVQVQRLE